MTTVSKAHKGNEPVATVEKRPFAAPADTSMGRKILESLGDLPPSDDDVFEDDDTETFPPIKERPVAAAPSRKRKGKPLAAADGERSDGSLQIVPATYEGVAGDSGVTTDYWCGTTGDSVIQNIDVLGVLFPRFVGVCSFDDKGTPDRPTKNGQILALTENKVACALEAVRHRVVRRMGRGRGQILDIREGSFRPNRNLDRPLGSVLYMVKTADLGFELGARNSYPTPLVSLEE